MHLTAAVDNLKNNEKCGAQWSIVSNLEKLIEMKREKKKPGAI